MTDMPPWLTTRLEFLWRATDLQLCRALIVGEAEGETDEGMRAVVWVFRNRTRYAHLGMTKQWHPSLTYNILFPHQASCFWADWSKRERAIKNAVAFPERYATADRAAQEALTEKYPDPTHGADHYFNPNIVRPTWAQAFTYTVRIDHHVFYRSV